MNAVQYWVIDNFIMDKKKGEGEGYEQVAEDEDEEGRTMLSDDSEVTEVEGGHGKMSDELGQDARLKEVDPEPITSHPRHRNGEGSGKLSPKND